MTVLDMTGSEAKYTATQEWRVDLAEAGTQRVKQLLSVSVESTTRSEDKEAVSQLAMMYENDRRRLWALECTCTDNDDPVPMWCAHIEAVISQNADAPWMHDLVTPEIFVVPVFPTLKLWAACLVQPAVIADAQRVMLMCENFAGKEDEKYLSLLDRNEGRFTTRELIVEFLKAQLYQAKAENPNSRPLFCQMSSHGYGEEKILSEIKTNTREFWAEAFSINVQGGCRKCKSYTNTASDVPEL